ncbi:MAG: F-type H+-transporting ATPase subunit epsilon [Bacillota bacterium]|nr:MAG: F-type H+-transporting ATPase subunit epsilon [Bacillota bacterium]MBS3950138.1 F0F1 ATP synthase subunit epsilon [Peptococcaceae bacterium]
MSSMQVEVVTPERKVVSRECKMVSARAVDGDIGILPRHIPLVTVLAPGVVKIKGESDVTTLAVSGGFLEVRPDSRVTILAETAELSNEIDVERARKAKQRAEDRLGKLGNPDVDAIRSEIALRKAMIRLEAAGAKKE